MHQQPPTTIVWATDEMGRFHHITDNIEALVGPTPEEMLAQNLPERIPFSGSLSSAQILAEERERHGRGPVTHRAWDVLVRSGRKETVLHVEALFLRDDGDRLVKVVGTACQIDVSCCPWHLLPETARETFEGLFHLFHERCAKGGGT